MSSPRGERKKRRSYQPRLEVLEALRLLSNGAQSLPGIALANDVALTPVPVAEPPGSPTDAWDAALGQTHLSDLIGPSADQADAQSVAAGISQLNRYLNRAWYRAGISAQLHDDSTQAVYVSLLQNLGSVRFNSLLADIGQNGIRDVLSRETADGPDFFRAVDAVKKRAQREKTFQPLDSIDVASSSVAEVSPTSRRGALQEAIAQSLTPREASLIQDTLMGKTPAEIALQWGVAPKTVSNEKTRALQKLREALVAAHSE
ncbi:MAG: sigma-70 family RNA polymerase sigma factor [Isosphaeraceae bacterium]|nr:sigma-70 family RNA polymerase sigma factor [Isosphaeraceae bacterium]